MDEFLDELRGGARVDRRPTLRDVAENITDLEGEGKATCIGIAQAATPYCRHANHESDVVAILIPTERTEARIRTGNMGDHDGAPNPAFRSIFVAGFDLHSGVRTIIILDIESAMEACNHLGTAIRLMQERADRLPDVRP